MSPTSSKIHKGPALTDVAERLLALLKFYGQGKRSEFVRQIANRVTTDKAYDSNIEPAKWWQVYNRLCDFGVISQVGSAFELSWQWTGDRLILLSANESLFLKSVARDPVFSLLLSKGGYRERELLHLDLSESAVFSLKYFVSDVSGQAEEYSEGDFSTITKTQASSFVSYMPSALDVFRRCSRSVLELPPTEDMEKLSVSFGEWTQLGVLEEGACYLLRKVRGDVPGYRYWLVDMQCGRRYEMKNSDWLFVILAWLGRREWVVLYDQVNSIVSLPLSMYFKLPAMLRHALILPSMRWPSTVVHRGERYFEFTRIDLKDAHYMARMYQPAMRLQYV